MIRQADWQHWDLSTLTYMSDGGLSSLSAILVIHTWSMILVHRGSDGRQEKWEQWEYLHAECLHCWGQQKTFKISRSPYRPPDFGKQKKNESAIQVDFPFLSIVFSLFISPVWGLQSRPPSFQLPWQKIQTQHRQSGADPMPMKACRWKDSIAFAKY